MDGHTVDDISIMPIEEVVLEPTDSITLSSKRLQREDFWYRKLCSVYPYGLNDSVKGVGNVSSRIDNELIVYTLFNKHERKFRRRKPQRHRKKVNRSRVTEQITNTIMTYKNKNSTFHLRANILNLPRNKLRIVLIVTERLVLEEKIPNRILLLVKDLIAYKFRGKVALNLASAHRGKKDTCKCYINVIFHDKGMDMLNLPRILNFKRVRVSVPNHLRHTPPPTVSYTYTRTIAGKIFNNRKVVEELDLDKGTVGMECNCSSSNYRYTPCGHVVTGDLSIIRNTKLKNLIKKGPTYREQNNIDWKVNV